MHLSLSVRIAEGFLSKEEAILNLDQVSSIAKTGGYRSVCMRASQIGIESSLTDIRRAASLLKRVGLGVSMVTGDFDIVYNNQHGPRCLRNIARYLDLASELGAPMIRVALKSSDDIPWAQRAADEAAERNIKVVHQCHTLSMFETVDAIERALRNIDRPNFGLIYEPANLELCGQDYGETTLRRLAPWIFNVYLQNQKLNPTGAITLDTWCGGPRSFDIIQIHEPGGINFPKVFAGLHEIRYEGSVTVHQSAPEGSPPAESASATADYLRGLL